MKSRLNRLFLAGLGVWLGGVGVVQSGTVLCTTFPIYQLTRNVIEGRKGMRAELLLPPSLGCPHHYSLTPQDMRKLARADVLVVNGLGLEAFLGAPGKQVNPRLVIVDSSRGLDRLLSFQGGDETHACDDHDDHDHDGHAQAGLNPHLFVSPRMAAKLALNIAAGLSQYDPEGASQYFKNANAYAARLNALADEMMAGVGWLKNNRIVQPHGIFDYLARDIGLKVVAVMQPHGLEPSAAEMLELIKVVRAQDAGGIFTEPQYSPKIGQTLSRETGVPAAVLDPAASGATGAPLDYYETVMRRNLEVLRATLGNKQ